MNALWNTVRFRIC